MDDKLFVSGKADVAACFPPHHPLMCAIGLLGVDLASCADRVSQLLEYGDRRIPVNASICDRHPLLERSEATGCRDFLVTLMKV